MPLSSPLFFLQSPHTSRTTFLFEMACYSLHTCHTLIFCFCTQSSGELFILISSSHAASFVLPFWIFSWRNDCSLCLYLSFLFRSKYIFTLFWLRTPVINPSSSHLFPSNLLSSTEHQYMCVCMCAQRQTCIHACEHTHTHAQVLLKTSYKRTLMSCTVKHRVNESGSDTSFHPEYIYSNIVFSI